MRALVFPRDLLPLRASLGSVGRERRDSPEYDWHGLRRGDQEMALFQYTLRGTGRLRVGAHERTVTPGDAMLLHFPADNRYWFPAESSGAWEFLYVCLHGRDLLRLWREVESRLGPLAQLAPDSAPVACAVRIIAAGLREEIATPAESAALALELVARLLAVRPPAGSAALAPQAAALARARAYAEQDLAAPIGVAELARAAGLSRFYFSRLFTEETGQTPAAWLATRRVQSAAQLLRERVLPIKEIAARCGFTDVQTFGKVFRRHTGTTPGRYRRGGG